MDRPKAPAGAKKGEFRCPDGDFLVLYPKLAQGMCDPWWSDGKPRNPWSMSITFQDTSVAIQLRDKDSKLVSFTNAPDMKQAFMAIEQALEDGTLSWRISKY